MKNKTIVIGCGRLGSAIASYSSQKGESVIVLDNQKKSFDRLSDIFSGYTIACDATDIDELIDAGIENARSVIITTGDDNVNLLLAIACADLFHVPYIYVRFDDPSAGLLIQGKPIHPIFPFQLSRDRFSILQSGAEK